MHTIDIILLIPLFWGFYKGFKKGFIIEVITFLSLILGIYAGLHFSSLIIPHISNKISAEYLSIAAFILIFIIVVVGLYFLGKMLERMIDALSLSIFNKIAGGFLGALKYILFIGVLISLGYRIGLFDKNKIDSPMIKLYTGTYNIVSPEIAKINIKNIEKINSENKE